MNDGKRFPKEQFGKIPFKVFMGSGAVAADHADAREAIQQGRNVIGRSWEMCWSRLPGLTPEATTSHSPTPPRLSRDRRSPYGREGSNPRRDPMIFQNALRGWA